MQGLCIALCTHILGPIKLFVCKNLAKCWNNFTSLYILVSQANDVILLNIKFMCKFLQKLLTEIRTHILRALKKNGPTSAQNKICKLRKIQLITPRERILSMKSCIYHLIHTNTNFLHFPRFEVKKQISPIF